MYQFLLAEGGLGGPVPDAWLASGAFLSVLTEDGATSDLVMEAATGRLYHRPTGHLVNLSATTSGVELGVAGDGTASGDGSTTVATISARVGQTSVDGIGHDAYIASPGHHIKEDDSASAGDLHVRATEQAGVAGLAAYKLESVGTPVGQAVEEVGVCLLTNPDGAKYQVEHSGEGITLETLQAILQIDS